jgi:bifunctional UDP-N-acetylglucosamine pyrophosphorylase/glucosamine-1-phosphate N-acetyltransferase
MFMKAVILAAGESTRTYPLTSTRPKTLLDIANKPILQHNLEALDGLVDEVLLIVGYKKEMIRERFGKKFKGIRLTYIEQKERLGTGHALLAAEPKLKERFFIFYGDDIYDRILFEKCLKHDICVVSEIVKNPERFGVWIEKEGGVSGFAEKPERFVSDLANTGLYVLDWEIFPEIRKLKKSVRGEYELNEAVNSLSKKRKIPIVKSDGEWVSIGYPWDLLQANERILQKIEESKLEGEVEENATIKGSVVIGKNTLVRSGSYIEGPVVIGEECKIGPNCYIRPFSSVGNGCSVGNGVEVKNSMIMDGSRVSHLSYIGDSILGHNVNIGGGNMMANLRHDGENVKSFVRGNGVDTLRRKFGTVIGDNVKTGASTIVYPGRKIWPDKTTLPGEHVKQDIM